MRLNLFLDDLTGLDFDSALSLSSEWPEESYRVEVKSLIPKDLPKFACGLANTGQGGIILIGFEDPDKAGGLKLSGQVRDSGEREETRLVSMIAAHTNPPVQCRCKSFNQGEDAFLIVQVLPGGRLPHEFTDSHNYPIRNDKQTRYMTRSEIEHAFLTARGGEPTVSFPDGFADCEPIHSPPALDPFIVMGPPHDRIEDYVGIEADPATPFSWPLGINAALEECFQQAIEPLYGRRLELQEQCVSRLVFGVPSGRTVGDEGHRLPVTQIGIDVHRRLRMRLEVSQNVAIDWIIVVLGVMDRLGRSTGALGSRSEFTLFAPRTNPAGATAGPARRIGQFRYNTGCADPAAALASGVMPTVYAFYKLNSPDPESLVQHIQNVWAGVWPSA